MAYSATLAVFISGKTPEGKTDFINVIMRAYDEDLVMDAFNYDDEDLFKEVVAPFKDLMACDRVYIMLFDDLPVESVSAILDANPSWHAAIFEHLNEITYERSMGHYIDMEIMLGNNAA